MVIAADLLDVREKLDALIERVSKVTGVSYEAIKSPVRGSKSSALARHVTIWVVRRTWIPQPTFPEIGRLFDREHTTMMDAVKNIDREVTRQTPIGRIALKLAETMASLEEDKINAG